MEFAKRIAEIGPRMIATGTIKLVDERNKSRFSTHSYRVPIVKEIRGIRDLDPDRLHYDQEYPRFCPPPGSTIETAYEIHLDYQIVANVEDGYGRLVELFVMPNKFSMSKKPSKVLEFNVHGVFFESELWIERALDLAFRRVAK